MNTIAVWHGHSCPGLKELHSAVAPMTTLGSVAFCRCVCCKSWFCCWLFFSRLRKAEVGCHRGLSLICEEDGLEEGLQPLPAITQKSCHAGFDLVRHSVIRPEARSLARPTSVGLKSLLEPSEGSFSSSGTGSPARGRDDEGAKERPAANSSCSTTPFAEEVAASVDPCSHMTGYAADPSPASPSPHVAGWFCAPVNCFDQAPATSQPASHAALPTPFATYVMNPGAEEVADAGAVCTFDVVCNAAYRPEVGNQELVRPHMRDGHICFSVTGTGHAGPAVRGANAGHTSWLCLPAMAPCWVPPWHSFSFS